MKKQFYFIFDEVIKLALTGMKHLQIGSVFVAYISRADEKNYSDQAHSCLRDWRLSAAWEMN